MKNQSIVSVLAFSALACSLPVSAMDDLWGSLNELDKQDKEAAHEINELLDQTGQSSQVSDGEDDQLARAIHRSLLPESRDMQEGYQLLFDPNGEDDLAEAMRLSLLELTNPEKAPQSISNVIQDSDDNDPLKEAMHQPLLELSKQERRESDSDDRQEKPVSDDDAIQVDNEDVSSALDVRDPKGKGEKDSDDVTIDGSVTREAFQETLREEIKKQKEGEEKKRALIQNILEIYSKIKILYEDYQKESAKASEALVKYTSLSSDSEERERAQKEYRELSEKNSQIYFKISALKDQERLIIDSYLLVSEEEKELLEKLQLSVKTLRKELQQKKNEKSGALNAYLETTSKEGVSETEKEQARRKWFALSDQCTDLELKLNDAIVDESRKLHYHFTFVYKVKFSPDGGNGSAVVDWFPGAWRGYQPELEIKVGQVSEDSGEVSLQSMSDAIQNLKAEDVNGSVSGNVMEKALQEEAKKQKEGAEQKERKRSLKNDILSYCFQVSTLYEQYQRIKKESMCDLYLILEDHFPKQLETKHTPAIVKLNEGGYKLIVQTDDTVKCIAVPEGMETDSFASLFEKNVSRVLVDWKSSIIRDIILKGGHTEWMPYDSLYLHLMSEGHLPEQLETKHAPAIVKLNDGGYKLIVQTDGTVKCIAVPEGMETDSFASLFEKNVARALMSWDSSIMRDITWKGGHTRSSDLNKEFYENKSKIYESLYKANREQNSTLSDYFSLASDEERGFLKKELDTVRSLIATLHEEVGKKATDCAIACDIYFGFGSSGSEEGGSEEKKQEARNRWFNLSDQHTDLQLKLDDAILQESRKIHQYFAKRTFKHFMNRSFSSSGSEGVS